MDHVVYLYVRSMQNRTNKHYIIKCLINVILIKGMAFVTYAGKIYFRKTDYVS